MRNINLFSFSKRQPFDNAVVTVLQAYRSKHLIEFQSTVHHLPRPHKRDFSLLAPAAASGSQHVLTMKWYINPFTAPACKVSGLKSTPRRLQTVYFPVLRTTNLLSVLFILIEFPLHPKARNQYQSLNDFIFHTFPSGPFQVTAWQ